MARIPESELHNFARSLYRYLYFKLDMYEDEPKYSPHFKEEIGSVVFSVRNATHDFNVGVWENCGSGVPNCFVCQRICDLYPDIDFFKKIFFLSGFILDMIWWYCDFGGFKNFALASDVWQMMFRHNFEREFESHGGWEGLLQAAIDLQEVPPNEFLPQEHFLPARLEGVIARFKAIHIRPEAAAMEEAILQLRAMRIGARIGGRIGALVAAAEEFSESEEEESSQSEEEMEADQPGKVAQAEDSKQESRPKVTDDRSGPHSSALGGSVAQTENLGEGTSGKSEEGAQSSFGGRNLRKRRHDAPPTNDSDEESDSTSKSKVEKK